MEKGLGAGGTFDSIRARLAMLETLEEAQNSLASESDPDAILEILAESAAKTINAETLAVSILSEDERTLRYEYTYGKHAGALQGMVLPIERAGLCGWVLQNRKPILSVNLLDDPRILRETAVSLGIHTALLTPLIAKGRIIGGLTAFNKSDGSKFDEEDLSALSQLSGYAALAVTNARLMLDLTRAKAKTESVIDNMRDGLLFVTCDGVISEANKAVRELGLTGDADIVGRNITELDPAEPLYAMVGWNTGGIPGGHCWEVFTCEGEGCPVYRRDLLRCWALSEKCCRAKSRDIQGREKLWDLCIDCDAVKAAAERLATPREVSVDGRTLSVTSVLVIERGKQNIFGELMVFHDVSAEKALERQRTEFISMLSHDLKTPVTSIIGYSELMAQERDPDSLHEMSKMVAGNSERLLRMINNALDYSLTEAGRLKMDRTRIGLKAVLSMAVLPFGPLLKIKEVSFVSSVEPGTRDAYADIDLVTRITGNLLNNAVEHVHKGGSIAVTAANGPEGYVEITVRDDGAGIKPEHLPHVFDKYFSPGRRKLGGSGLGLFIVKALCELQGGRVSVESEPGRGATFRVLLPAAPEDEAPTGA